MKIKIRFLAVIVPVILFGGILASAAAGVWSTSTDKKPATYASGDFAGEYNPADIRGSYTFEEISGLFGIESSMSCMKRLKSRKEQSNSNQKI